MRRSAARRRAARSLAAAIAVAMGLAGELPDACPQEPQVGRRGARPGSRAGLRRDARAADVASGSWSTCRGRRSRPTRRRDPRDGPTAAGGAWRAPRSSPRPRRPSRRASACRSRACRRAAAARRSPSAPAHAGQPVRALERGDADAPGARRRVRHARRGAGAGRRLQQAGSPGGWVVEEAPSGAGRLRLLETDARRSAWSLPARPGTPRRRRRHLPRAARGAAGDDGTLTVVNVAQPRGLPARAWCPTSCRRPSFPQIEALKAQAVAARTYALRNRGQFAAKGYDICATPACQVYRGPVHRAPALRPGGGGDARHRRDVPRRPHQRALHLHLRRPHRGRREHLRGRGRRRTCAASPACPSARPGSSIRTHGDAARVRRRRRA